MTLAARAVCRARGGWGTAAAVVGGPLLAGGCAAKAHDATPLPPPPSVTAPPVASAPPPEAPPPSLDALAARQVRLAPGMHELARGRGPLHLPKAERDTCVRVAFASATPTTLRLVDRGTVLAAATTADGALGEHGPVCFRRGAEPLLELSPDAGASAFVVWAAP